MNQFKIVGLLFVAFVVSLAVFHSPFPHFFLYIFCLINQKRGSSSQCDLINLLVEINLITHFHYGED